MVDYVSVCMAFTCVSDMDIEKKGFRVIVRYNFRDIQP